MKSIKLLLSLTFILSVFSLSAQDDFYNDSKKKNKEKTKIEEFKNDDTIFRIDEYSTEQDYNEEHNITSHYEVYEYDEHDDSEKRKRRRRGNSVVGEVVAEIVVEVFVNALLIAAFWN